MVGSSPQNRHLLPLVLALLSAGCSAVVNETPVDTVPPGTSPPGTSSVTSVTTTTTSSSRTECIDPTGGMAAIDSGAIATDALTLSSENFVCALDVVVVSEGNESEAVAAAQLAAAMDSPLLFPHPLLAAELGRLKPERVHVVGSTVVDTPSTAEVVSHDIASAVQAVGVLLEAPVSAPVDASSATGCPHRALAVHAAHDLRSCGAAPMFEPPAMLPA